MGCYNHDSAILCCASYKTQSKAADQVWHSPIGPWPALDCARHCLYAAATHCRAGLVAAYSDERAGGGQLVRTRKKQFCWDRGRRKRQPAGEGRQAGTDTRSAQRHASICSTSPPAGDATVSRTPRGSSAHPLEAGCRAQGPAPGSAVSGLPTALRRPPMRGCRQHQRSQPGAPSAAPPAAACSGACSTW